MKNLLILCLLVIAQISYSQDLLWKTNFTGTKNNIGTKSAIDSQNNIYVIGSFNGTINSPISLTTKGLDDGLVMKFDADGTMIWAKQIGGTSNDYALDVTISPDNEFIYVTGIFSGTASAENFSLTSSNGTDGFLAKYTKDGEIIYFKNIASGSTIQRPNGINIDKNNHLVISGIFTSEAILGSISNNITFSTSQAIGMFISQFDTSGVIINAKKFEASNVASRLYTFDLDTSGYYLVGHFKENFINDFGTITSNNSSLDMFIYKVGFDLNSKWFTKIAGTADDQIYSCSTDDKGNFYFGGYFASSTMIVDSLPTTSTNSPILSLRIASNRTTDSKTDIFFAKYRYDGQLQWFNTAGSTENDYLYRALYKNGNFIAAGQYGGQLTFNNKTITPRTAPDAFAIVHSQKNYLIDLIPIGGDAADVGETALVDYNNDIVVIGDYTSTRLYFDTQDSIDNSEAATKDMFVVKYRMSKITDPAIVVCDDQYRFNNYIGLGTSNPDSTLTILGGEHITGGIKADGTVDASAYKLNGVPFTGSGDSFWRMFDSNYATIGDTGIVVPTILADSASISNAMLGDTSNLATFTDSLQVLKHGNTYVAMTDTGLHYINCDTTNRSKYWVPTWEAVKNQITANSGSGGVTPRSGLFYWNSDSSSYWLYSTPKDGVFFDMGGAYYNTAAMYNRPIGVLSGVSPGFIAQTGNDVAANFSSNYNAGIFATTVSGTTNAVFGTAGDSVTFPRTGGIRIYRSSILNSSIGELNDSTFKGQSLHLTGGAKIDGNVEVSNETDTALIRPGEINTTGNIKSGDYLELDAAAGMFKAVEDANNYSYLGPGGLDIVENSFAISFRVDKTIFSNGNDNTIIKPDGIATTDYIKVGQYGQGHITLDNTFDPNISIANAGGDSLNISPIEIGLDASGSVRIDGTSSTVMEDGNFSVQAGEYESSLTSDIFYIADEFDTTTIRSYHISTPKLIAKDNNNYHKFEADSAGMRIKRGSTTLMKIDNAGLIYATPPHAALYRTSDLTITSDQNVWYKITGFTVKDSSNMLIQGDSIQIKKAGSYNINFTVSFSGANNEIWEVGVFKAGVAETPTQLRYTSSSDVGNMSIPVYVESDGDDWFSFKIRNTTDGDDPTIRRFSAIITTVHLNL